jgi:hypothetical protein
MDRKRESSFKRALAFVLALVVSVPLFHAGLGALGLNPRDRGTPEFQAAAPQRDQSVDPGLAGTSEVPSLAQR